MFSLWVFLVVRSLLRGMTNFDTADESQQRLRELPTELETFFEQIMNKVERVYQEQAARLYQICLASEAPPNMRDVSWFAIQDLRFALRNNFTRLDLNSRSFIEGISIRINARCQDLLEVKQSRVQFLHRTVKDFLETKDVSRKLKLHAGKNFNSDEYLCNAFMLQMKFMVAGKGFVKKKSQASLKLFCILAKHLESRNRLDLEFFPTLDKIIERLLRIHHQTYYRHEPDAWLLRSEKLSIGFLANEMARQGIRSYLSRGIGGKITVFDQMGKPQEMNPFKLALKYLEPEYKCAEVLRLLEEGADPNEQDGTGISVWESYIQSLCRQDIRYMDIYITPEMVKSWLLHGADPAIYDDETHWLLSSFLEEEAQHVVNLRLRLLH